MDWNVKYAKTFDFFMSSGALISLKYMFLFQIAFFKSDVVHHNRLMISYNLKFLTFGEIMCLFYRLLYLYSTASVNCGQNLKTTALLPVTTVQARVQTCTMAAPISGKCDIKTDGRLICTTSSFLPVFQEH